MATTEVWQYAQNQFDNATKGNYKLMYIISSDHLAKLQGQAAEPDIAAMQTFYMGLHNNFVSAYTTWLSIKAGYKASTETMSKLLDRLVKEDFEDIETAVRSEIKTTDPRYKAIFPNGKKPFTTSNNMDLRIAAVDALSKNLGMYPKLAPTKDLVNALFTQLDTARKAQQAFEGQKKSSSEAVEVARVAAAQGQFRNLGLLIARFYQNPASLEQFWELKNLRRTKSKAVEDEPDFVLDSAIPTKEIVAKEMPAITAGTRAMIENMGAATLRIYTANEDKANPTGGIEIPPNTKLIKTFSDIGNTSDKYILVSNGDAVAGLFRISFFND